MRLSRRQGLQLMLGAAQAVFVGAAGCALTGYAATVAGRSGGAPLAHWRCSDSQDLFDEQPGARHGAYTGSPSLVSGLPADSDQALSFPGDVYAEVADDTGLHLGTFSLSGWVKITGSPTAKIAVWSKDASGLNDGDFALTIDEDLFLGAQFQSASTQFSVGRTIQPNVAYSWAVVAGAFGFDFFVNGQHVARNTSFTAGWTNNDKAIQFAKAPWTSEELVGVLDEVAVYDYMLTDADVAALAQKTGAPVASADGGVTVTENQSVEIDVTSNDTYVGRKENLTVEVWNGSSWGSSVTTSHGTATVNASNNIDFAAGEVTQDEADSFQYRITDANGTSSAATVDLTVQETGSAGEGTLVYQWEISEALAQTWIDGVAITDRDVDDVLGPDETTDPSPNIFVDGATVGGNLVRKVGKRGNFVSDHYRQICLNRDPFGNPAIEIWCTQGDHGASDWWIELYPPADGNGPRHIRVLMEVLTANSSHPTTHKPNGLHERNTDPYTHFTDSHINPADPNDHSAIKYLCCVTLGDPPRGAALTNFWEDPGEPIDGVGWMIQSSRDGKNLFAYEAPFNRDGINGGIREFPSTWNDILLTDPGVDGYRQRLEHEVKLCTPSLAQDADARRQDPPPSTRPGTGAVQGDGEIRIYITRDLDGLDGGPYPRELLQETTGFISSPWRDDVGSDDDMHLLLNLTGPWFNWYYGGGDPQWAKARVAMWLTKIEVYVLD